MPTMMNRRSASKVKIRIRLLSFVAALTLFSSFYGSFPQCLLAEDAAAKNAETKSAETKSAASVSLQDLAHDFWQWRAQYQPFSQDDIPRIERPLGPRD